MTPTRIKVLVVEDERLVALDIEHMLTNLGYDVCGSAATCEAAIARASTTFPDVVLMDIRIKGQRDGIETASLLHQRFDIPVIYLTAHADATTIERAKETAPYGYLTKPFTEPALAAAIEIANFRHQMDRKLRERERWFSTTLSSIGDAVVTVDLKGRITYLNPAAEQLLGVPSGQAIGHLARSLIRLEAPDQPESPLDVVLQSRRPVVVREAKLKSLDGLVRTISDSASPVIDNCETLGAVMVFRDVTEEKRIEKRIELADRLASLGTMAAGIAHEINNPLAVVLGNATMVLDDLRRLVERLGQDEEADRQELRAMIDSQCDILGASERISRFVGDMRTLSQPPAMTGHRGDVAAAIDWAVRATAHEFAHRAIVQVENPVERCFVKLESARLEQILINLLMNAAHAIPSGHVRENRVVVRTRRESGRVVLEISDTGTGMTPEVLQRLFEPFFTTKALDGGGTGLGLSICRGIVTGAGGDLQAESQVGKGSLFRVWLPEAEAEDASPTQARVASAARRARILVIDDEPLLLRTLSRLLANHDVVCSEDAREALALLERDPNFDPIFCDLMMPNVSGMAFYEALLARAPALARRVVFLTGGVTNPAIADFLAVVENEHLEKPVRADALQEVVQRHLAMREPN